VFLVLRLSGERSTFVSYRARGERSEALSIPGTQCSRNGRGSEYGASLVYAPHGAAQAGLTGGADRSSRLRHETDVEGQISRRMHLDWDLRF
jgi:hypothetical protein